MAVYASVVDPCLSPVDPDPKPAIYVLELQEANKKLFSAYYFFEGTFASFF